LFWFSGAVVRGPRLLQCVPSIRPSVPPAITKQGRPRLPTRSDSCRDRTIFPGTLGEVKRPGAAKPNTTPIQVAVPRAIPQLIPQEAPMSPTATPNKPPHKTGAQAAAAPPPAEARVLARAPFSRNYRLRQGTVAKPRPHVHFTPSAGQDVSRRYVRTEAADFSASFSSNRITTVEDFLRGKPHRRIRQISLGNW